jgi:hypothetical protein
VFGYGRALNSRGVLSTGQDTSAPLKQKGACTPYPNTACGKQSEPPGYRGRRTERLTVRKGQAALLLMAPRVVGRARDQPSVVRFGCRERKYLVGKNHGLFCVFEGAVGLDGRVRALAAGSCSIQDANPVLFERGACGSSGGRATPRVHRAPGYCKRPGDPCAARAGDPPSRAQLPPQKCLCSHLDSCHQHRVKKNRFYRKKV